MIDPSPVAHRIREALRAAHKGCDDCALGRLWAEDIQVVLDLAAAPSGGTRQPADTRRVVLARHAEEARP